MKSAVVIGSGVIGLCAADSLLRRGYEVTILERDPEPGQGCSYGNGGLIVPSHFEPLAAPGMVQTGLRMLAHRTSPFGFKFPPGPDLLAWMAQFARAGTAAHVSRCAPILSQMNLRSRELYETVYADVESGYVRSGELMICQSAAGLATESHLAHAAGRYGLTTRILNRRELAEFETGIEIDAEGAVYFEDDAHLTPALFMANLVHRLRERGVRLKRGVSVTGFGRTGATVDAIHTSDGVESASVVVVAAGSWSGRLAKLLNARIPLMAGKGYGFTIAAPPATPRYPAILTEGRVAVTPMRDGLRFVGTMELGPPEPVTINPYRVQGMRRAIAAAYPQFRDFDFEPHSVWGGLRPCAPDGMPYIGPLPMAPNVIIATGHGMMGLSLGPITGELVGQIADSESPSVPLELLSPCRFL